MNQTRKDVLNGWKEIAAYLGRDPRTVERWEKQRSLPVRRLPGSGRATVYALISELDGWLASSPVREVVENQPPSTPEGSKAPLVGTAQIQDGAGGAGEGAGETAVGGRMSSPWTRWSVLLVAGILLCWAAFAALGLRRGRMRAELQPERSAVAAERETVVPSSPIFGVEELYLRGCYQMELRTPESLRRAEEAFSEASRKDETYAPAYAGLASTYLLLREYSMLPDAEAYPRALASSGKALSLDPDLPQAHAAMGFADFFWRWDSPGAERQFRTALKLNPQLTLAHHWYGSVLMHEGRFREGLSELSIAQRLDPGSAAILTTRAFALGLTGRRDQAVDMLQEALSSEQYQNAATTHAVMATLSLMAPRNMPRYLAETTLAAELRRDEAGVKDAQVATRVYRAQGEAAMWRALLHDEQQHHPTGGPTYQMARYEAELGAREEAMNDLAALFARHESVLIGMAVDPLLVNLHGEPRYAQLRAAMGLPTVAEN